VEEPSTASEADIHGTTHILWITKDGVAPHPVDDAKIG
jgi:hypothetical protein